MKIEAPVAERKVFYTNYLKDKVLDPYFWLREKENPKVISHLKRENIYFEKYALLIEWILRTGEFAVGKINS